MTKTEQRVIDEIFDEIDAVEEDGEAISVILVDDEVMKILRDVGCHVSGIKEEGGEIYVYGYLVSETDAVRGFYVVTSLEGWDKGWRRV